MNSALPTFDNDFFYARDIESTYSALSSQPDGLSSSEAQLRQQTHGRNELTESEREPSWKRFFSHIISPLNGILLIAAIISTIVAKEIKTAAVVLSVVLINAIVGFIQENRAAASLQSLKKMLSSTTTVRRDGTSQNVPVEDLVPGDVVLLEAGDRIPADGRITFANSLEIEEAALTGESTPVTKTTDPVTKDAALGDRKSAAYMNSVVTRGRGEMLVTHIGMSTEIGRIAHLLQTTEFEKSPLQRQLDDLAHVLAKMAGVVVAIVFIVGVAAGESIGDQIMTAVALAVASIPEGLPAVTAVTLAIGVAKMAKQNAIVKRLSSVETLGCTSVICSDKTGTLTVNEMTALEIVLADSTFSVTGEGYSPIGHITPLSPSSALDRDTFLMPAALCTDARVYDSNGTWRLIGDPTEGAIVTLALKSGIDVDATREQFPRITEIPFDSGHKFMTTFHSLDRGDHSPASSASTVRMITKGAPDVLMGRCTSVVTSQGSIAPISQYESQIKDRIQRMGESGLRVLAIARRDLSGSSTIEQLQTSSPEDLHSYMEELQLLTLVGIIDPPRPEARTAIATAHAAGIDVKMITGDHASTATAIARELGLAGAAISGHQINELSDEELSAQLSDTSVFARVSPEHKIRIVSLLQQQEHVVAMTGDGVNDAPALKKADIGIAMGITGTEVTKDAATMVLTDDNFATIVAAVQRGRAIYDNIIKFVKFQLTTTISFAMIFLLASIFDIAHRAPFTAIAILWVNIIMDGPPAMSLGVDKPSDDVMFRTPRPTSEPILTLNRWISIGVTASVMATGALFVFAFAPGNDAPAGAASVATTMGFNTFVLAQFFNILSIRNTKSSVFSRYTFTNRWLWLALTAVIALQALVTHTNVGQSIFDTTTISAGQWFICIAVAATVLIPEELRKLIHKIKN